MGRWLCGVCIYLAVASFASSSEAQTTDVVDSPGAGSRQINVSGDSTAGWRPSQAQIAQARKVASEFLAAQDAGRYSEAYGFLSDRYKATQSPEAFSDRHRKFRRIAGTVVERRVVSVTWTSGSPQARLPGIYAAIDLVSRFAHVDRHCGYLVLYEPPDGSDFHVIREDFNYLDNAAAKDAEQRQGRAAVDKIWSQLSANCPNYSKVAAPAPIPEQASSTIGYPTVSAALQALRSKRGVIFRSEGGWIVATDNIARTFWSFTPATDPAYPAVVKRQIGKQGDGFNVRMEILCQAGKAACDNLVVQFKALNEKMLESLREQ